MVSIISICYDLKYLEWRSVGSRMPIDSIIFENGIYYCRQYGNLSAEDAQLWADKALEFAHAAAPRPIVALIDALNVQFVSMDARHILAKASGIEGLELSAVVTQDSLTEQSSRIINVMAVKKQTYLFKTIEEARTFLEGQLPYLYTKQKD